MATFVNARGGLVEATTWRLNAQKRDLAILKGRYFRCDVS
jgi:hypothetical protein